MFVRRNSGAEFGDALQRTASKLDRRGQEFAPAAVMRRAHSEKLHLCEALEEIADSLPAHLDRLRCLDVANVLVPLLRDVHRYEEATIFPAYNAALGEHAASPTIRRLRTEHVEDECFADEVTEVLLSIGHGGAVTNTDALGFMLRGLFETLRRHIAFEQEHVLPITYPVGCK